MDKEIPPEISYEIIAHVFADCLDDYISKHYVFVLFPGSPKKPNDYDQVQAIMFLFWTGGQVRAIIRKLISDTLGIDVDIMTGLRSPLREQMENFRHCYQFILSDATVEGPYRETEELFDPPPIKFECQETPFCQAYKKFFETVHMFNELQALIYNINEYRPDMSDNWLRNFLMLILRARSYLDDDITEVADSFSEIVSCFSSSALKIRLEVKIRETRVAIEGARKLFAGWNECNELFTQICVEDPDPDFEEILTAFDQVATTLIEIEKPRTTPALMVYLRLIDVSMHSMWDLFRGPFTPKPPLTDQALEVRDKLVQAEIIWSTLLEMMGVKDGPANFRLRLVGEDSSEGEDEDEGESVGDEDSESGEDEPEEGGGDDTIE